MTVSTPPNKPAELLKELGITEPEEIHIEAIAEYCGATIVYQNLEGCEARIIGFGDRAIITVNVNSNTGRQRFSAGHELGHWMRDRGRLAFACQERIFTTDWLEVNPEQRANRYAGDLLLPDFMFQPLALNQEVTFRTVETLATRFSTSLTSTAIRLVEKGPLPAMIICNERGRRRWFFRGPAVPESLWPHSKVGPGTVAFDLFSNTKIKAGPIEISAHQWIEHPESYNYRVVEDSTRISPDLVLTLLWWNDERQILDLDDEDPDQE
jgi:Zn-dependent peptidase ImmA (M78 family)